MVETEIHAFEQASTYVSTTFRQPGLLFTFPTLRGHRLRIGVLMTVTSVAERKGVALSSNHLRDSYQKRITALANRRWVPCQKPRKSGLSAK